jgi:hypothetical protein
MEARKIKEGIYWVGAVDWDRRMFDDLINSRKRKNCADRYSGYNNVTCYA